METKYIIWDKKRRAYVRTINQLPDNYQLYFNVRKDLAMEFDTKHQAKTIALKIIGKGKFEIKKVEKNVTAK